MGQLDPRLMDGQGKTPEALCLVFPINMCVVNRYSIKTERDGLTSDGTPLWVASAISPPGQQLCTEKESHAYDEQDPTPGVHPPNGRAQSLSGVPPTAGFGPISQTPLDPFCSQA